MTLAGLVMGYLPPSVLGVQRATQRLSALGVDALQVREAVPMVHVHVPMPVTLSKWHCILVPHSAVIITQFNCRLHSLLYWLIVVIICLLFWPIGCYTGFALFNIFIPRENCSATIIRIYTSAILRYDEM